MSSLQCSVCLDLETDDNQILKCNDCGVYVHIMCYGIEKVEEKWKCSPCGSSKLDPVCCICIQTDEAMKKRCVKSGYTLFVHFSPKESVLWTLMTWSRWKLQTSRARNATKHVFFAKILLDFVACATEAAAKVTCT